MLTTPRPPRTLRAAGRRLWAAILAGYELDAGELALLELACQAADDAAAARASLRDAGPVTVGRYGQPIMHPAALVARQAEASLSRILRQLNVIDRAERPIRDRSTPGPKPLRRSA
jgi:hypothetical protein